MQIVAEYLAGERRIDHDSKQILDIDDSLTWKWNMDTWKTTWTLKVQ